MLLEFRVSNHRSIFEEQVLTSKAVPRLGEADDERARVLVGVDGKYLPALAIYGANASGKTNVLDALLFMQEAVISSHRVWEPNSGVPRSNFKWGGATIGSTYEVEFVYDNVQYKYGFAVDSERVLEEWLFSTLNGQEMMWFTREENEFKFGEQLKLTPEQITVMAGLTGSNSLFLSAASQSRIESIFPIYLWFRSISSLNFSKRKRRPFSSVYTRSRYGNALELLARPDAKLTNRERNLIDRVKQMLSISDFGIVDFKCNQREQIPKTFSLKHSVEYEDPWLPLTEESQGTQTMFKIALQILESLDSGCPLLFDELETSLHPLLAMEIVKLFNSKDRNPKNAQLIFTTHDLSLIHI